MANQYFINNTVVSFEDNEPHTRDEAIAYLEHGKEKHGNRIKALTINRKGDEAELHYTLRTPTFERIRRITGYLVGTVERWNNAKTAELKDRVKHDR